VSTPPELSVLQAQLRALTEKYPGEAMFAIMEVLIEIACGDNPALRDIKRRWLYVGILTKLKAKGLT
jgi:hypothetical protein